jgi:outer membrane receptor protein involved in Fe transport
MPTRDGRWLRRLRRGAIRGLAAAILGVAPIAAAQEPAPGAARGADEPEPGAEAPAAETGEAAVEEKAPARPPPPARAIEEIVIRGGESDASADFQSADSVTAFGAEDIAALGAQSIADLAEYTPNLEIVTAGATTPTFFIRGVGLNDFNANSTGAVAIYQDDVPINAPALQLGTLFDVEAVNVLRGPQGTGDARNASAGAIKLYSRKPSGELGAFLRSEIGNYAFRDFEGAVEAPLYEDILAGRFAFRFSERDGTVRNGCGDAPPLSERVPAPDLRTLQLLGKTLNDAPWSICGEGVPVGFVSEVPTGLEEWVNNLHNWAARGTMLFQPTLDTRFLINAHGSRRHELSRLGRSYGTNGEYFPNGIDSLSNPTTERVLGLLGAQQGTGSESPGYQPTAVKNRWYELAPCLQPRATPPPPAGLTPAQITVYFVQNNYLSGTCDRPRVYTSQGVFVTQTPEERLALVNQANAAKIQTANELAAELDSHPWRGDYNLTGPTINDTWGTYLAGEIALPWGMQFNSVTAYDTYDREINLDLDFSPETLFQIMTQDQGWQWVEDLRLEGELSELPVRWNVGGWLLREHLDVLVENDLGDAAQFGAGKRDYTQDQWSAAGYAGLSFDFWNDFTLDGGFRYNWEHKWMDYLLTFGLGLLTQTQVPDESWNAPTGTIRLTYRFREDTHAYWKYTRGWKPGTFNATSSLATGVSIAEPESIDAFETGVRGSWFEGRVGLDLSVFYYNYQDYQLFTAQQFSGGQPEFVILNADKAEVYGAEIDAVARPWLGSFFNVRFGWLESQFLDFVQLQQDIIIVDAQQVTVNRELNNTGNPLLNSPRFKVSLTGEQTIPLGRYGSLSARYDGVWTATTYYDATKGVGIPNNQNVTFLPDDTIAQDPYWVHNVRLAYRPPDGRIEIAGWVRNLTDQEYKTFAFDGSTFNRTTIYFVSDPRTYGGTVIVNF